MRRESDFDRKGCLFATWLIVIVFVGHEICWIVKGEWITAIITPLLLPLLFLIPWGIIELLTWSNDKSSKDNKDKQSDKENSH